MATWYTFTGQILFIVFVIRVIIYCQPYVAVHQDDTLTWQWCGEL